MKLTPQKLWLVQGKSVVFNKLWFNWHCLAKTRKLVVHLLDWNWELNFSASEIQVKWLLLKNEKLILKWNLQINFIRNMAALFNHTKPCFLSFTYNSKSLKCSTDQELLPFWKNFKLFFKQFWNCFWKQEKILKFWHGQWFLHTMDCNTWKNVS